MDFAQFQLVDLRIGTVRSAERVPGSDKLVDLTVDFGEFVERVVSADEPSDATEPSTERRLRRVVSGIGGSFEPDALIGQQYLFVVNLPPRSIMGIESEAMILAADAPHGLALLQPTVPVPAGERAH